MCWLKMSVNTIIVCIHIKRNESSFFIIPPPTKYGVVYWFPMSVCPSIQVFCCQALSAILFDLGTGKFTQMLPMAQEAALLSLGHMLKWHDAVGGIYPLGDSSRFIYCKKMGKAYMLIDFLPFFFVRIFSTQSAL